MGACPSDGAAERFYLCVSGRKTRYKKDGFSRNPGLRKGHAVSRRTATFAAGRRCRVVGLMSGTSADGVDAAVCDVGPRGAALLAFETFPYPPSLRAGLFRLFDPASARVDGLCSLNVAVGEAFAEAVVRLAGRAGIPLRSIDLIGSHGQTVWHDPRGRRLGGRKVRSTLQIGEPSVIAERTGITTVADFRPRDMAAGGQGAPLVPLADWLLFRHSRRSRAVQNIGGIANVTHLPAGAGLKAVRAFDTGPGNMMIDRLAERVTGGRLHYDAGGKLAGAGTVNRKLLREWMRHPFLRRRPPKTTGREEFGAAFADAAYRKAKSLGLRGADLLATATAFTAESIADAYRRYLGEVDEAILCGGGARNPVLVGMLREALGSAQVILMDALGLNADAKEAVSFAVLAYWTVRGLPGNVPSATGAARAVVLGKIVPGLPRRRR